MNSEDPGPRSCHKCQEKGNLRSLQKRFGDAEEKKQSRGGTTSACRVGPAFKKTEFKEPDQGLADKYHQALLKDSAGLDYLRSRGISPETADRFCLGLEQDKGMRWLSIPHFQKGRLLNIKFRSMPPAEKTFRRIPGFRSIHFNATASPERRRFSSQRASSTPSLWCRLELKMWCLEPQEPAVLRRNGSTN